MQVVQNFESVDGDPGALAAITQALQQVELSFYLFFCCLLIKIVEVHMKTKFYVRFYLFLICSLQTV